MDSNGIRNTIANVLLRSGFTEDEITLIQNLIVNIFKFPTEPSGVVELKEDWENEINNITPTQKHRVLGALMLLQRSVDDRPTQRRIQEVYGYVSSMTGGRRRRKSKRRKSKRRKSKRRKSRR